jgi:CheY-like chemotaxis protein
MTENKMNGEPVIVLLVEDNVAHAELVIRSFEDHRIANKIYHVSDGEVALDYLFRRGDYAGQVKSPVPHLVLLDLRLPKIDGLEVLKEIKSCKELEKIPTVIFTTSSAEMDVAKAYEHHANSYLVKPVSFEKFNRLMEDIGFYWLAWNYHPWGEQRE